MKWRRLPRQVYVDLVRRRSTVRVTQAVPATMSEHPIFLVGVYRSGTTLLRYTIDSHPRIACPPESDFMLHLVSLLKDQRAMVGLDSMGFDREHVEQRIEGLGAYFFENYARSAGKARWADKSPSYVDALPHLVEIFPEAQFVTIHRHPLDQVHSHTNGGTVLHHPIRPFCRRNEDIRVGATRYWVDKTEILVDFDETSEASYAIRYEELCSSPEAVLIEILSFLGEKWDPAVLSFNQHPHDVGMEAASTRAANGFRASSGNYSGWPPEILEACSAIAKPTAAKVGYRL